MLKPLSPFVPLILGFACDICSQPGSENPKYAGANDLARKVCVGVPEFGRMFYLSADDELVLNCREGQRLDDGRPIYGDMARAVHLGYGGLRLFASLDHGVTLQNFLSETDFVELGISEDLILASRAVRGGSGSRSGRTTGHVSTSSRAMGWSSSADTRPSTPNTRS